jgi:hypothetical protein
MAFFDSINGELKNNKILLITDDDSVKGAFNDRLGSGIIGTGLPLGRRTMEEQRAGVVEWLLLQKCGMVLGSAGSSFSEMAVRRSGGRLLVATLAS